jgi:hypothetical protein
MRPELTEYFRTLLRGDHEANDRIEAKLHASGWEGFPRLLAALFFLAVDRRFGRNAEAAELIKFVAELRADLSHGGPEIDPTSAELLIRSILDPSVDYTIGQEMIGKTQAATVYKVFTEESLTEDALDALLAEAVQLADQ